MGGKCRVSLATSSSIFPRRADGSMSWDSDGQAPCSSRKLKKGEGRIKEISELDNRPAERVPGEGSPGRELGKPAEDSDLEEVSSCGPGPQLLSLFQFFSPYSSFWYLGIFLIHAMTQFPLETSTSPGLF